MKQQIFTDQQIDLSQKCHVYNQMCVQFALLQSLLESMCAQYLYVIFEMCVLFKKLLNYFLLLATIQHHYVHSVHDDYELFSVNLCCLIYD